MTEQPPLDNCCGSRRDTNNRPLAPKRTAANSQEVDRAFIKSTQPLKHAAWKEARKKTEAWWERWQQEYLEELRSASLKPSANND